MKGREMWTKCAVPWCIGQVQFPDGGHAKAALADDDAVMEERGLTLADEEDLSSESVTSIHWRISYSRLVRPPMATIEKFFDYLEQADYPVVHMSSTKLYAAVHSLPICLGGAQ